MVFWPAQVGIAVIALSFVVFGVPSFCLLCWIAGKDKISDWKER